MQEAWNKCYLWMSQQMHIICRDNYEVVCMSINYCVPEITTNENESLTFCGNLIATKVMEVYMNTFGEK